MKNKILISILVTIILLGTTILFLERKEATASYEGYNRNITLISIEESDYEYKEILMGRDK